MVAEPLLSPDEEEEEEERKERLISPGLLEMEKRLGGGLPPASLTLIEGDPDAGKSVFTLQLVYGALKKGYRCAVFVSEATAREVLEQMDGFGMPLSDYYLLRRLALFDADFQGDRQRAEALLSRVLRYMAVCQDYELFVVDSITPLIFNFDEWYVLSFLAKCKELADMGRTIIVTLHSYAMNESLRLRANSIVDAHLRLRIEELGNQLVRTLEVVKVRGAVRTVDNTVSFTVEPGVGIKSVPITRAKA